MSRYKTEMVVRLSEAEMFAVLTRFRLLIFRLFDGYGVDLYRFKVGAELRVQDNMDLRFLEPRNECVERTEVFHPANPALLLIVIHFRFSFRVCVRANER